MIIFLKTMNMLYSLFIYPYHLLIWHSFYCFNTIFLNIEIDNTFYKLSSQY